MDKPRPKMVRECQNGTGHAFRSGTVADGLRRIAFRIRNLAHPEALVQLMP